jgi:prepilin-type N-terminal cleavage/methylation domain-containing protein
MKKSGFSLLEIIVVTAIMGIVMLLFSPMINAFIGAQDRLYNQSKVDSRLNEVVEFIKRDVRNARSSSELGDEAVKVYNNNMAAGKNAGNKVIMYTYTEKKEGTPPELVKKHRYVQYLLENNKLKIRVENYFDSTLTGGTTILSDVKIGEFKYDDRILLFHFKIDVPKRLNPLNDKDKKIRNEVRDVGITRINLQ